MLHLFLLFFRVCCAPQQAVVPAPCAVKFIHEGYFFAFGSSPVLTHAFFPENLDHPPVFARRVVRIAFLAHLAFELRDIPCCRIAP